MKKEFDKRRFLVALIYFVLCAIGLYIFIDMVIRYDGPSWFYHPLNEMELLIADIGRGSLFTYFTYLSLFTYSVWGILRFFAVLLENKGLLKILTNKYLITFLTANEILTLIAYTASQGFSAVPYGFVNFQRDNFLNFLSGIYIHYVLTIASIVYFFVLETPEKMSTKITFAFSTYPLLYAFTVKMVGLYAFNVEWYPYAIFSKKAIWLAVFKNFNEYNANFASILIAFVIIFCTTLYVLLFFLLTRFAKIKHEKILIKN